MGQKALDLQGLWGIEFETVLTVLTACSPIHIDLSS